MIKHEKYKEMARYWQATRVGNGFYIMKHWIESFMDSLKQGTCTCEGWELSGIPCPHSLAVMRGERLNPLTFVHDCYKTEYLKLTYHTLVPINGEDI